jgi:anionic cell wall polymer biosynthesis LytR-Cps2A-Psr (LCP) family protein
MEELMRQVYAVIGFMPDGYMLVNLDAFVDIVNLMGGVDFDVPMDMSYCDPAQNLYISLSNGYQHLDGEQSIQLVRFRSGYAMADLGRVSVQRDFVQTAMKQWLSLKNIPKLPKLFSILKEDVITDLTPGNMLWLAKAMKASDLSSVATETLPGEPATINGGSYFVADSDAQEVIAQKSFSPYEAIR